MIVLGASSFNANDSMLRAVASYSPSDIQGLSPITSVTVPAATKV
jgi:hypothetical protein